MGVERLRLHPRLSAGQEREDERQKKRQDGPGPTLEGTLYSLLKGIHLFMYIYIYIGYPIYIPFKTYIYICIYIYI